MKKINKTPLAAAMGVAVISTFSINVANAEVSPFGMTELSQGYMQVAEADKTAEMACGEHMSMPQDTSTAKPADAKAAEMKCGGMMDGDKMKKGMEGACGEMMKGKEAVCGMMAAGESMKGKESACGAGMKMPAHTEHSTDKTVGTKVIPFAPAAK